MSAAVALQLRNSTTTHTHKHTLPHTHTTAQCIKWPPINIEEFALDSHPFRFCPAPTGCPIDRQLSADIAAYSLRIKYAERGTSQLYRVQQAQVSSYMRIRGNLARDARNFKAEQPF